MIVYPVHRSLRNDNISEYYVGNIYSFESPYQWIRAWLGSIAGDVNATSCTVPIHAPVGTRPIPNYALLTAGGRPLIRRLGCYDLLTCHPFPSPYLKT